MSMIFDKQFTTIVYRKQTFSSVNNRFDSFLPNAYHSHDYVLTKSV